jgi:hypothetical protein
MNVPVYTISTKAIDFVARIGADRLTICKAITCRFVKQI